MPKQFILNADGTAPSGVNIALLIAQNVPLVLPTPAPSEPDMIAVEQEPQQDADGFWRQVWTLEPKGQE